jgi:hypothetical protein
MTAHVHAWRMVSHLDGCHYFSTSAACACGATLVQSAERDVEDDPYSRVWMTDDDTCERCRELLAGAAPEGVRNEVELPR